MCHPCALLQRSPNRAAMVVRQDTSHTNVYISARLPVAAHIRLKALTLAY